MPTLSFDSDSRTASRSVLEIHSGAYTDEMRMCMMSQDALHFMCKFTRCQAGRKNRKGKETLVILMKRASIR